MSLFQEMSPVTDAIKRQSLNFLKLCFFFFKFVILKRIWMWRSQEDRVKEPEMWTQLTWLVLIAAMLSALDINTDFRDQKWCVQELWIQPHTGHLGILCLLN